VGGGTVNEFKIILPHPALETRRQFLPGKTHESVWPVGS